MERIAILEKIESGAHHFLHGLKGQYSETKGTALIIQKYMVKGSLTEEEEHELKQGLVDSLKMAGVMVPFVLVPGASIIMPILIKVASKHNIELMPSTFRDNDVKKPEEPA